MPTTESRQYLLSEDEWISQPGELAFEEISPAIGVLGDLPKWQRRTSQSLLGLLNLPEDWDGYGAPRISNSHVEAALDLLQYVMQRDTPPPSVVPTVRGGVQLEWHIGGVDLEIETIAAQRYAASFEDLREGIEREHESLVGDLSPLIEYIRTLTERTSH